eukprot:TRINITY_DN4858_c0_g1_i1.p1 TRINITY_DN4858_c0_g1~~TRINITY_DN4858_c0_g1_i1.p1  ORF type:complete len:134 (+),score=43.12 TRINITY_DN4858_c0_g1_i1:366-767(+)
MKKEIKVYRLLKASKGVELIVKIRNGLREVKETLNDQLEMIQSRLGIAKAVTEALGGQMESYLGVNEDPFSKNVSLSFEVELVHERALLEFENFEILLTRYFEKIESEQEIIELKMGAKKEIEEERRRKEEEF